MTNKYTMSNVYIVFFYNNQERKYIGVFAQRPEADAFVVRLYDRYPITSSSTAESPGSAYYPDLFVGIKAKGNPRFDNKVGRADFDEAFKSCTHVAKYAYVRSRKFH